MIWFDNFNTTKEQSLLKGKWGKTTLGTRHEVVNKRQCKEKKMSYFHWVNKINFSVINGVSRHLCFLFRTSDTKAAKRET